MTAVMTAPVRVPGQAGPPAIERTDPDARQRWELVDAAKAGDRAAFAELYRLYHPAVYRFVRRRCGNHHLAEDLTGDTFVKALRSISRLEWQGRDVGAWFVTIARNLVADYFKSGRYRLELPVDVGVYGQDHVDDAPEGNPSGTVVDQMEHLRLSGVLAAAIAQLTAEQRRVIELRFFHHLSIADTAAALGKLEGATKALQYRAMQSLMRLLPASVLADRC